jgi:O-antigen ligase
MPRIIHKNINHIGNKPPVSGSFYPSNHRLSMERRAPFLEGVFVVSVYIFGTGLANVFDPATIAGYPIHAYFWFASYAMAGGILCLHYGIRWIFWVARYRSLLGIVLFAAIASVLWSIDPVLTLQRAIHLIGTTLIACYIGIHIPVRAALSLLAWALIFITFGNAFVALAIPSFGQENLYGTVVWKGWNYTKNGLGSIVAIAVLFFAIHTYSVDVRRRWVYQTLCVLSFLVLLKTNSATGLVTVLVGAGIAISLSLANRLRLPGWITGSLLSLLLVTMGLISAIVIYAGEFGMLTSLVGRSADLTGRTGLWDMVLSMIKERPWLGYGYGALWNPKPDTVSPIGALLESQLGWLPPSAHNGFMNIASELGIPIATIVALFAIQSVIESLLVYLRRPSTFALLVLALLSAMIVRMFTEQIMFTSRSLLWIIFVALPIILLRIPPTKRYVANEATRSGRVLFKPEGIP